MLFNSLQSRPIQVPESEFETIKQQIVEMTSSSNRSTRPAIYGIVAAAEVERLRPVTGSPTSQSDVATLELAAAEMAQVRLAQLHHP